MFNGNSMAPSLSDIAAVAGRNNDGDGWGNGNGWWILIILFALWGGFGGYGGYGAGMSGATPYNTSAATQADIQRGFDTQAITNKLNGLENGLCSLGYDQLSQINNLNTAIMQTGYNIQNGIQANTTALQNAIQSNAIAAMQNTNALQSQITNNGCENRESIAQVRYDMATGNCAITNAINQAAQNIMQNDNANYRQIHDELIQSQLDAKDAKIAEQASLIQSLNLAQSQANQNQYLVSQLKTPTPVPAFNVPNPFAAYYAGTGCCGTNV